MIVLFIDQLVSTTRHAALQLGSIVVLPVEQATEGCCATGNSADDGTLVAIAAVRVIGGASRHAATSTAILRNSQVRNANH